MQNSPARAAGVAIATKANVHSAAADAATILEIGFIFLSVSSWSFLFYLSIDRHRRLINGCLFPLSRAIYR